MTQCEMILKYMQTHKRGITPIIAMNKFGCMRLASRIHDLRERGYKIMANTIEVRNRNGEKCHVCEYKLVA